MSKTKYSAFKVLKEALTGHKGWEPTWRDAEPKADGYDVVIVGDLLFRSNIETATVV